MPIGQYLEGERFDPETTRIMGIALETARAVFRDQERSDRAEEMIAKNIIALAKTGERDADRLCNYALAKLREADGRASQLFQSSCASRTAASDRGGYEGSGTNNP